MDSPLERRQFNRWILICLQPFEMLIPWPDLLKFERYEQGFLLLTDLSVDAANDLIDPGFTCISRLLRVSSNNLII
ncbi:MAG TPA: hypothetical protein DCE56_21285 [Cyanobacteria bacterium UBA8553]|nr:hypothetical protein [Cyanobacteria bacterium UBA8553]